MARRDPTKAQRAAKVKSTAPTAPHAGILPPMFGIRDPLLEVAVKTAFGVIVMGAFVWLVLAYLGVA